MKPPPIEYTEEVWKFLRAGHVLVAGHEATGSIMLFWLCAS